MSRKTSRAVFALINVCLLIQCALGADTPAKPKAAVFPLGGTAKQSQRDSVAFSFRAKLDREGTYEPIDGPMMKDLAAASDAPLTFATSLDDVRKLSATESPTILLWGQLDDAPGGALLKLHSFDTRHPDAAPSSIEKTIKQPTDLRFVTESILQTLPGIQPFEHPSEVAVQDDPASKALWAKNPNLVVGGDFEKDAAEHWYALLHEEKYHPPVSSELPDVDKIAIVKNPDGQGHVLAMNMSKDVAESNGLGCISDSIPIEPHMRYRLQLRFKSDGPGTQLFVKGYSTINGEEREVYRRQVPSTGITSGKWVTLTDDLNPQHGQLTVQTLKVDLYVVYKPGLIMFDDVVLKAVGSPTHVVNDPAVVQPNR